MRGRVGTSTAGDHRVAALPRTGSQSTDQVERGRTAGSRRALHRSGQPGHQVGLLPAGDGRRTVAVRRKHLDAAAQDVQDVHGLPPADQGVGVDALRRAQRVPVVEVPHDHAAVVGDDDDDDIP